MQERGAGPARQILVLIGPGSQASDVVSIAEVFCSAARYANRAPAYWVDLISVDEGPCRLSSGIVVQPGSCLSAWDGPVDTLWVAGFPGMSPLVSDAAVLDWLRRLVPDCRRVAASCTASFVLAEAGCLDGRRATTHWQMADQFAARYPAVRLDADAVFVEDGPMWTSAGMSASVDAALAMVEADCGRTAALRVAHDMILYARRSGGQPQLSSRLAAQFAEMPAIQQLQLWICDNLREDLAVERLAERVHMSPRNFARVFLRETGHTPGLFVERARVELARGLLDERMPLQDVASQCGFLNANALRRAFVRQVGLPPGGYRQRNG
ncbi:helix-turn-helix domain-containing protein [Cupriavidus basilensis]|uniref:Helix-turn-helix domain-containing protein n=1 Tax=Cupriavidus basilensis TaxID=68895 RepID=A0ABT6ANU1_9BURK|nr:helix-turn-helix domain-containing protein [Cupriavidus basilensis]MDF3834263.1 helix-turn-helix domain-containing protein [Cupriavidus basilensis]